VNRVARLPEFVDPERHMQMQNENDLDGSSLENSIWTGPKGKDGTTSQVVVQEKNGAAGWVSAED
jgi:hypothetical protein